jgi:hypothetical protein
MRQILGRKECGISRDNVPAWNREPASDFIVRSKLGVLTARRRS